MNKVIKQKKLIKSRYAHISALRGTTRAGPHWTASFSRGGPAAGGLFIDVRIKCVYFENKRACSVLSNPGSGNEPP